MITLGSGLSIFYNLYTLFVSFLISIIFTWHWFHFSSQTPYGNE